MFLQPEWNHHQSQVKSCCQSGVLSPVRVYWSIIDYISCILVSLAAMLLAIRLKWRKSVVIG